MSCNYLLRLVLQLNYTEIMQAPTYSINFYCLFIYAYYLLNRKPFPRSLYQMIEGTFHIYIFLILVFFALSDGLGICLLGLECLHKYLTVPTSVVLWIGSAPIKNQGN